MNRPDRRSLRLADFARTTARAAAVLLLASSALLGAVAPARAQAPVIRSTRSGVYTEVQAAEGAKTYDTICSKCHANPTNPLKGQRVIQAFSGHPLYQIWTYITTNMPQSAPGTLPQQQYADVLAYILKINGYPAGNEALPPDPQVIANIDFDPPGPPK